MMEWDLQEYRQHLTSMFLPSHLSFAIRHYDCDSPITASSFFFVCLEHGFVDIYMTMITAEAFRPRLTQFLPLLPSPSIHWGLDCRKLGAYHFIGGRGARKIIIIIIIIIGAQNFGQQARMHKTCARNIGGCTVCVSVCTYTKEFDDGKSNNSSGQSID